MELLLLFFNEVQRIERNDVYGISETNVFWFSDFLLILSFN